MTKVYSKSKITSDTLFQSINTTLIKDYVKQYIERKSIKNIKENS